MPPPEINTPFGIRAKELVSKTFPEELRRVAEKIINRIDQQGVENYRFHDSEYVSGVSIGYTVIETNQLKEKPGAATEVYAIFPGFGVMKPRAWPFMSWDMALDRAFSSLSKNKLTKIIVLGSDLATGSHITKEWLSEIKKNGFAPLAKEYAAIIATEIESSSTDRLILNGMSFGCTMARLSADYISKGLLSKTTLLLDNPMGDHPQSFEKFLRGLQIAIGFVGEGALRTLLDDPHVTQRAKDQQIFWDNLPNHLRASLTDTPEQENLKQILTNHEINQIIVGLKEQPQQVDKTYIRRGIFDLTTVFRSVKRFAHERLFPLKSGHGIYRIRPKQWQRQLIGSSESEEK